MIVQDRPRLLQPFDGETFEWPCTRLVERVGYGSWAMMRIEGGMVRS
jgi:hypothetical protein